MAFKDEVQELSLRSRQRLEEVLARWANENPNAAKALIADRFLPQPEMAYLARRLPEFPAHYYQSTIDGLEAELKRHCKSWLQLKGGKVIPAYTPKKVGTFVLRDHLRNHLLKNFGSLFPNEAFVNRFLRDLDEKPNPAVRITRLGCADIRIRADHELAWLYWDAEGHFKDMLAMLEATARQRAEKTRAQPMPFVFLIFDISKSFQGVPPASGKGLHRPSWADFALADVNPVKPCPRNRFGITEVPIEASEGKKPIADVATAVGRSAYFRLADLAFCKIQYL